MRCIRGGPEALIRRDYEEGRIIIDNWLLKQIPHTRV